MPAWMFDLLLQAGGDEALPGSGGEGAVDPAGNAAQQAAENGGGGGGFGSMLPLLLGLVAIFYFLILRPENRKRKEREKKVQSIKKGDKVVTNGGMFGEVVKITEGDVTLEVDKTNKVRIRFSKTAILDIVSAPTGDKSDKGAAAS